MRKLYFRKCEDSHWSIGHELLATALIGFSRNTLKLKFSPNVLNWSILFLSPNRMYLEQLTLTTVKKLTSVSHLNFSIYSSEKVSTDSHRQIYVCLFGILSIVCQYIFCLLPTINRQHFSQVRVAEFFWAQS